MASRNDLSRAALTIAGFDPSGGAGVLADARTFAAFGFTAFAAVTSITCQNGERVSDVRHQTGEAVRAQVMPLLEAGALACVKTGMLPTRDVVREVARMFRETSLPAPVVDPVMASTSGYQLMEEEAIAVFIEELLPLARLVTPNIPEAEQLTGIEISSVQHMQVAAAKIREMGARAVLIKGGHLKGHETEGRRQEAESSKQKAEGSQRESQGEARGTNASSVEAIDVLDNEGLITVFRERRIPNVELHGTGCILSAAIAAGLGNGLKLEDAVGDAKSFLLEEIRLRASD